MHPALLRALQAVCLLLGFLVLRSVVFVYRLFLARWRYSNSKAFSKIPGPPAAKLVIGHVTQFMGAKGVWNLAAMAEQYGPLIKLQMLTSVVVVLSDPQTISRVSRKTGPGPYMSKPNEVYKPLEKALQPALPSIITVADGPYWKAVRQAAAPCFSITNLKNVMPLVLELTKRVAACMDAAAAAAGTNGTSGSALTSDAAAAAAVEGGAGALFDVSDAAKRITSDVMGHMLLGEDLQGTQWKPSEYLELFYPVVWAQGELMNNPWHLWQLWRSDVRLQRSCLGKHNDIMNKKMDRLIAQPPPEYTIAAHLLKARVQGRPLTRDQLKTEVAAFMAAGFETTSHAITWTLAALAAHQDVQQQLVDELAGLGLAAAAGDSAPLRDIDQADFSRLPLMSAVLKEVLRLCPPAPWGGTKQAPTDVELCGYTVKKGTLVMMPLLPLSLASSNYGPDAMLFKPQRWMTGGTAGAAAAAADADAEDDAAVARDQEQRDTAAAAGGKGGSIAAPDPHTFMTGPRDCIGQALAKLELQVVLATLLARFRFLPGPKLQQELQLAAATGNPPVAALHALAGVHVTMQPEDGKMLLLVQPRC